MSKSSEVQSGTVTVACKLPHGLALQLFEKMDHHEPVMGGGVRKTKQHQRVGPVITVHGVAVAKGGQPKGLIINGYALTSDIPADFWQKWLEQNQNLPAVKNKLIFAHGDEQSARAEAHEHRKVRTGMEPIDPRPESKDPRMPRGIETKKEDDLEAA